MKEHLSALFRTHREAVEASQSLMEQEGLCDADALFVFPLGSVARAARPMPDRHEVDHAEYAGHGEQMTMMSINHFVEPFTAHLSPSPGVHEDGRQGHALVVIGHPPQHSLARICDALKGCGAFAIRCPGDSWHLCHTRRGGNGATC
ncbi:hypothetical protein Bphy_5168 [Paraburkholderia phymatum STM815]|uniref:Uncharacterized protein n=1 Tax=Paraburkholderia phymatum (strain DSM 17167 / CIP 108236 / LMG 21445 / STM815) TaxID=391038 RepID=B2JMB9_PARP8|nr:hypothetical protein Bphy_5168 [Paraburkholderia phymatum STM815]